MTDERIKEVLDQTLQSEGLVNDILRLLDGKAVIACLVVLIKVFTELCWSADIDPVEEVDRFAKVVKHTVPKGLN